MKKTSKTLGSEMVCRFISGLLFCCMLVSCSSNAPPETITESSHQTKEKMEEIQSSINSLQETSQQALQKAEEALEQSEQRISGFIWIVLVSAVLMLFIGCGLGSIAKADALQGKEVKSVAKKKSTTAKPKAE